MHATQSLVGSLQYGVGAVQVPLQGLAPLEDVTEPPLADVPPWGEPDAEVVVTLPVPALEVPPCDGKGQLFTNSQSSIRCEHEAMQPIGSATRTETNPSFDGLMVLTLST